jgi:predicted esterase
MPLIGALMEHGRFLSYFGTAPRLFPLARVDAGDKIPALFIIHGIHDSIVSVEGSEKFVQKILKQDPTAKVQLSLYPGGHGLDIPFNLDHPWLSDGLKLVIPQWLG